MKFFRMLLNENSKLLLNSLRANSSFLNKGLKFDFSFFKFSSFDQNPPVLLKEQEIVIKQIKIINFRLLIT